MLKYYTNLKISSITFQRIACVFLLAFAVVRCGEKTTEKVPQSATNDGTTLKFTDKQLQNADIEVTELTQKSISTVLKLTGKVDVPPQSLISVSAPLGGYLKSTKLLPGMHVKKGEIIAVLEDQQFIRLQQEYLQAKSKLNYLELDFKRQQDLNSTQSNSNKVFQLAQSELENQRILSNALSQQLQLININPKSLKANTISNSMPIYSQIDGFVSKVNVNIGKYVNPSEILFELIDPKDIHLNLKVYEKDIQKLSIGQKIFAFTNSAPEKKYAGSIILIGKSLGTEGVSEVHCHFDQYDNTLIPGTYMNAEVELNAALAFVLPEESVVTFEGKEFVFIQTGSKEFKMQAVSIGEVENGFIEITTSAALVGQKIVTKNAYTLLMALKNTEEEE